MKEDIDYEYLKEAKCETVVKELSVAARFPSPVSISKSLTHESSRFRGKRT
jgi:hypothetical protein